MNKAASELGKLAAGKPKRFGPSELARRKARLAEARLKRWPKHIKGSANNLRNYTTRHTKTQKHP